MIPRTTTAPPSPRSVDAASPRGARQRLETKFVSRTPRSTRPSMPSTVTPTHRPHRGRRDQYSLSPAAMAIRTPTSSQKRNADDKTDCHKGNHLPGTAIPVPSHNMPVGGYPESAGYRSRLKKRRRGNICWRLDKSRRGGWQDGILEVSGVRFRGEGRQAEARAHDEDCKRSQACQTFTRNGRTVLGRQGPLCTAIQSVAGRKGTPEVVAVEDLSK